MSDAPPFLAAETPLVFGTPESIAYPARMLARYEGRRAGDLVYVTGSDMESFEGRAFELLPGSTVGTGFPEPEAAEAPPLPIDRPKHVAEPTLPASPITVDTSMAPVGSQAVLEGNPLTATPRKPTRARRAPAGPTSVDEL